MAGNPYLWSTTAATNSASDPDINFAEGQLPGTVNDSARAVMAGVAGWLKDVNSTLTTGGSANAQTVTSNIAITALATGLRLHLKAGFANTAACTLNLTPAGGAAFGAKAIKIIGRGGIESDPVAGQICINGHYIFEYDAAAVGAVGAWILLNPTSLSVVVQQVFTASGTYTPTAGMRYCIIECVGCGGGGGGANGVVGQYYGGAGGGAGGYSRKSASAATIGASQTVTIGAGGAAGAAAGPGAGGTGGNTSVGVLCTTLGGNGGGASGPAAGGVGGGAGGATGTGDVVAAGAPGGTGIWSQVQCFTASGNGGSSIFGGGGVGVIGTSSIVPGVAGSNYGSGGSGGHAANIANNTAGGAGSVGIVIITDFI